MDLDSNVSNFTGVYEEFAGTWVEFFRNMFLYHAVDLPEIIFVIPLICTIGALLELYAKKFPIPLPVMILLIGCTFEMLSFTSDKVQKYLDAIQWMDEPFYVDFLTAVIVFNVAFNIDVYMLHKVFWQILLISIPGFLINYILILWHLASVDKLKLKGVPWLLFMQLEGKKEQNILRVGFRWSVRNNKMDLDSNVSNFTGVYEEFAGTWVEFFRNMFLYHAVDLPEIIFVIPLICTIGALLELYAKKFPIPLPVMILLIGCTFEMLSFTSDKVQKYLDAIKWMDEPFYVDFLTAVIVFNVAFNIDVYMLHKVFWQILLISIPGFLINYILILWHLASVDKLKLKGVPWLLFSVILVSSDPMQTVAAIKDLGFSRGLVNLIHGESLMTSIMSFIMFESIVDINSSQKYTNHSLAHGVTDQILSYHGASFLVGIISSKLIQLWLSTDFGDDTIPLSLSFAILYLIFYTCKHVEMSGIFTLATIGLFFTTTSFQPEIEELLRKFWTGLSFVASLMVFTLSGLRIPAQMYSYISFSDIYYSLHIYFTLLLLRLLVLLFLSPLLFRLADGFSWHWVFIVVWSEMKAVPNMNMALQFALSDFPFGTEKEKSQILFHGVSVCIINLIVNKVILPMVVSKLGPHDVTSANYKSLCYLYQRFREIAKSAVSALKFDKDLASADWSTVEKAVIIQNPYAPSQGETTEDQTRNCPRCNEEIDETPDIETVKLANRRLLSAQMASYMRQHRNEILSQSATQMLVGAAESLIENGEYMSAETIKNYSESKNMISFVRKILIKWVYNTKKAKGARPRHFLHLVHKIVFTDEFECIGYFVVLMNMFTITISWIPTLEDIYDNEIRQCNHFFLALYILETLLKIAAMKKEYLQAWNLTELFIVLAGILEIMLLETQVISDTFNLDPLEFFFKSVQLTRILRILKLITPKLLQLLDKRMSHQLSFSYALLKGYVQGEADVITVIDQIPTTKQVKQMLLRRTTRNMVHAMKELGYLEFDYPEMTVSMKTKEEINVMLSLAIEIVEDFRLKGVLHQTEASEMNKLIMDKKRDLLDFQPVVKPLTVGQALYHIPWLDKNKDHITFIQERAKFRAFHGKENIFEEHDAPLGIYVILSGMIKLQTSKPSLITDQIPSESEEKDHEITFKDYVTSGEIIGELNCLTNQPMEYSATSETVVELCFISKNHLYEAFRQCPGIEYKMWLKLGLSITAKKLREHLPYKDWNYQMQLKLCNVYIRDIPKSSRSDIYDETIIYIILIHGAVEDCRSRKAYKAPFLIPITCHQIQGTEDFTKVMIVHTPTDVKKFRRSARKCVSSHRMSRPAALLSLNTMYEEGLRDQTPTEMERPEEILKSIKEEMNTNEDT